VVVKDGAPRGGHRQRQAEATKDQIARAARALFAEHGYAATTIAAIATAADIPVQTVYSALGSKARILERITGQWMAESQTVPLAEAYLREPDPREQLRLLAALNRRQLDLGSDVIAIYQEAARAEASMAQTLHQVLAAREREIRKLVKAVMAQRGAGPNLDEALDITLALTLPEVYRTLVGERGWSPSRYETWLAESLAAQLLPGSDGAKGD
jgi:AcrR family transcriptional regulator